MTCERYWRDGILLDERGERDLHRDTCDDCRRAHRERELLVWALPEVGAASAGDPDWQNHVWREIARQQASRARRSYWLGGALAAAGVLAAVALYLTRQTQPVDWTADGMGRTAGSGARPWIEIVSGQAAMRSSAARAGDRVRISVGPGSEVRSARVGDQVRISVGPGSEVRIYRADQVVLRCPAWRRSPGCTPDAVGLVADAALTTAGDYHLVTITSVNVEPSGALDLDLATVVEAGGDYRITDLSVR